MARTRYQHHPVGTPEDYGKGVLNEELSALKVGLQWSANSCDYGVSHESVVASTKRS